MRGRGDYSEGHSQKIWFLQLTRVVACLMVVYTHWFSFLMTPNVLSSFIRQDPLPHYPSVIFTDYLGKMTAFLGLRHFSAIYFGLGLFFLLSGYVIPLSLKNSSPRDYFIRRVFRIYPTLIICLLIAAGTMSFAHFYLDSSQELALFQPKTLLGNMLLVRDVFCISFIENSTWTLDIEIHFYLLFFLFFYFSIEKKPETFLGAALFLWVLIKAALYVSNAQVNLYYAYLAQLIVLNGAYLTLMFVGTALYYVLSKQWPFLKGFSTAAVLLGIHYLALGPGIAHVGEGRVLFENHLYVLSFFLLLYFINDYLPYSKLLNKLAEISYPLYLLHGFTGYTLYFLVFKMTNNVALSMLGTSVGVLGLVFMVHYKVEQAGIAWSKRIIKGERPFLSVFPISRKLKSAS